MKIPPGFKVIQVAVRIITCPKCGHSWDDSWPADTVPVRGRRFHCIECNVIFSPEYPEPTFRLT